MFLADGRTDRETDRQTDRQTVTDRTKLRVAFRNFANASKTNLNPTLLEK